MTLNCSGRSGKGICKTGCVGVREEDAAASTADFSCRGDGDQQSDRSTKRGGQGVLYPRPPTGVPARGARRAELPDVHQPDDREWGGKTQRDRADVWRANDHGEALYEVVPGQRAKGFYEAKPQHSSASVLKGQLLEQAQRLLRSVPEVAEA